MTTTLQPYYCTCMSQSSVQMFQPTLELVHLGWKVAHLGWKVDVILRVVAPEHIFGIENEEFLLITITIVL